MIDLAAIIARAHAAHAAAAPAAPAPLVRVKRDPSGRTVRAVEPAAPVAVAPAAPAVAPRPVPTAETAGVFLAALRAAGKRPNANGVLCPAGAEVERADERAALTAFCGYNVGAPHGAQLDAARRTARTLTAPPAPPSPTRAERRAHLASLSGYVAGVPDAAAREARAAAANRALVVGLVCDLRRVATRDQLRLALERGGDDSARFALYLADDDEAVAVARERAAALAAEHGIG